MKNFLEKYGELPVDIGEVVVDNEGAEMCFVQYLPIRIPLQKSMYAIPKNLKWVEPIVKLSLFSEYIRERIVHSYVYLTVKRVYGSGNREGWHCDGFGTDDVNYIWYDSHPTEFYQGNLLELRHDHKDSMLQMSELLCKTNKIITYPVNHLIRMNQSSIHRVNQHPCTNLRTFVKISFSNERYNLKGNAHNHLLNYDWNMVERGIDRNHPIGEML